MNEKADMLNQDKVKKWIELRCPLFWSLLNARAQGSLPKGLIDCFGLPSEIDAGRKCLEAIERYLTDLKNLCGWQAVKDSYRKCLSRVTSEKQVAELFCEIAVCASVGKLSGNLRPKPPTGKGTHSDCLFNIKGFEIYGEVKRYVDPWPLIEKPGDAPNEKIPFSRSIAERPSEEKPHNSARNRSTELRSKLRNVHRQFPDSGLNILFVFHHSFGDTDRYLKQALFGDANYFNNGDNTILETDGLFSTEEWRNISACYLARCDPKLRVIFPFAWKNPRAVSEIPDKVSESLHIIGNSN